MSTKLAVKSMTLRGYSWCSILKGVVKVGQEIEVRPDFVSKDSEVKLNLLQNCSTLCPGRVSQLVGVLLSTLKVMGSIPRQGTYLSGEFDSQSGCN